MIASQTPRWPRQRPHPPAFFPSPPLPPLSLPLSPPAQRRETRKQIYSLAARSVRPLFTVLTVTTTVPRNFELDERFPKRSRSSSVSFSIERETQRENSRRASHLVSFFAVPPNSRMPLWAFVTRLINECGRTLFIPAGHVQCVRSKEKRVSRNSIALPRF